jgi:diadenosine tetraphosphatase ApaH/serine/threonine PP2A family protein phosphatase
MRLFDLLPIAAIVDTDVFSVHGGLSPELILYEDLLTKDRQKEIGEKGVIADLTWSDPDEARKLEWRPNARGAGFVFGEIAVTKFCHRNRLRLITRSHQLVMAGFQWYFQDEGSSGRLINVWSVPNYQYQSVVFEAEVKEKRIDKQNLRYNPVSSFAYNRNE